MASSSLKQQIATMRQSLFDEGFLDGQFLQLESLENVEDPNFVMEVFNQFFSESPNYFNDTEQALEATPINLNELDRLFHKFKGSCLGVGARKVTVEVNQGLECIRGGDVEGGRAAFRKMKQEFYTLKNKMEAYFQLRRQATFSCPK